MPSSDVSNVPFVIDELVKLDPESILDIGVGFGKWGCLAREYLEVPRHRFDRADWRVRIDGIEIFPGYRNPTWSSFYDEVLLGNALDILPTLDFRYDVIVACDVLEHLDRDDGIRFIDLVRRSARHAIITTPAAFWSQDEEAEHNEHEQHLSVWSWADFEGMATRAVELQSTFGVVLGEPEPGSTLSYQRRLDSIGIRLLLRALGRRAMLVAKDKAAARR
jgi:hypothetical protein